MEPKALVSFFIAYLIGSVDFGVIIPRLSGVDIYTEGSGNPGTSNVMRTVGRGAAALTLLGDLAKGMLAAAIADVAAGEAAGFAAGFAAVVGHSFPIWHRFRGGKGVAAAGGSLLWLEPIVGIGFAIGWAALVGFIRVASIASLTMVGLFVPALVLTGHRGWSLVWAGATAIFIVARHSSNIRRILEGRERPLEGPRAR